jgi:hypothetical protein
MTTYVPPSINETGFNCPHCGVLTSQEWHGLHSSKIDNETRTPFVPDQEWIAVVSDDREMQEGSKAALTKWANNMQTGLVFFEERREASYSRVDVNNLWLSACYNCTKISVWIKDRLVFPASREADAPNQDMPEDVIRDFEEARTIVGKSPRGAAALLRLCIQKLCIFLGEKGSKIDADIASLVKKGLNPIVQRSLDVVRVVGNDSVHPGTMDLNDDRDTALKLFKLVNLIAEQMISVPKSIDSLYESLPAGKREAIARRDGEK